MASWSISPGVPPLGQEGWGGPCCWPCLPLALHDEAVGLLPIRVDRDLLNWVGRNSISNSQLQQNGLPKLEVHPHTRESNFFQGRDFDPTRRNMLPKNHIWVFFAFYGQCLVPGVYIFSSFLSFYCFSPTSVILRKLIFGTPLFFYPTKKKM